MIFNCFQGGFNCTCLRGFKKNSTGYCHDEDECASGKHNCPPGTKCINKVVRKLYGF